MDRILSAFACALALNLVGFTLPALPFADAQASPPTSFAGRTVTVMGITGSSVPGRVLARMYFTVSGDHGMAELAVATPR